MRRGRKLVVVSHCLLNQNSVVHGLARAPGGLTEVVTALLKQGWAIYQLPCPELRHAGMTRPPKTWAEYDTKEFAGCCRQIAGQVMEDIGRLIDDGVAVVGVIGVAGSPSCDITGSCGHLYRALLPELRARAVGLGFWLTDLPADCDGQSEDEFVGRLRRLADDERGRAGSVSGNRRESGR
ncbi:MAG: hypothetical protein N3A57_04600 [Negativicutes bacterium]|nr:hypothetical protein [Negativicutes bacterium]